MEQFFKLHHPFQRWTRSILFSAIVGVFSGLCAMALASALHLATGQAIGSVFILGGGDVFQLRWELLLFPAAGGLLSGLVVQGIARSSKASGTDAYVQAFHQHNGNLELREPSVNAVASVGVIASGCSAGPEGPIAALGAAIGSGLGRVFRLSPKDRRILLVAGCAGGVGAIFGCPLGGALFATSVLYRQAEFEGQALVSAFIASVVSYSTYMGFLGYGTHLLKGAGELNFRDPVELLAYLGLGVFCGLTAIFLCASMSLAGRFFDALKKIPFWLKPALGGLLAGGVACLVPQVMDGEYRFVQNALDGSLFGEGEIRWLYWLEIFTLVVVAKCIATAFTLRSGCAGGMLGPCVFIGGAVGAFCGALFEVVAPGIFPEMLREAMIPVGMAGVLAASMRTPIAAMVMVTEMTGSYGLVVPLMLVTTVSYLVAGRWGLVRGQVSTAAESPVHAGDSVVHLLESYSVRDVMETSWPYVVHPSTTLGGLLSIVGGGTWPYFVVLEGRRLVGIISVTDILLLQEEAAASDLIIAADLMQTNLFVVDPHDSLYQALNMLQERKLTVLPVVREVNGGEVFVGMVTRKKIYDLVRKDLDRLRKAMLQEHAGLAAIEEDAQRFHVLDEIPETDDRIVERIPVPPEIAGLSLRDANFRNAYHSEVVAIRTEAGQFICPADPNRILTVKDTLVVMLGGVLEENGSSDSRD